MPICTENICNCLALKLLFETKAAFAVLINSGEKEIVPVILDLFPAYSTLYF